MIGYIRGDKNWISNIYSAYVCQQNLFDGIYPHSFNGSFLKQSSATLS